MLGSEQGRSTKLLVVGDTEVVARQSVLDQVINQQR